MGAGLDISRTLEDQVWITCMNSKNFKFKKNQPLVDVFGYDQPQLFFSLSTERYGTEDLFLRIALIPCGRS